MRNARFKLFHKYKAYIESDKNDSDCNDFPQFMLQVETVTISFIKKFELDGSRKF